MLQQSPHTTLKIRSQLQHWVFHYLVRELTDYKAHALFRKAQSWSSSPNIQGFLQKMQEKIEISVRNDVEMCNEKCGETLSCAVLVIVVLSPACCVFTNSLWPQSSVCLAGFLGARRRWRRPVFLVCQTPAVCPSPLRSCLLDRCQSSTPGLSTLNPHTHRGNYSLGACLLSPCSTIYHQSVHRHLSSSPLHPDITVPRGLNPQVLQLLESLLHRFLSPSPLPAPPSLSVLSFLWLPHYSPAISLH